MKKKLKVSFCLFAFTTLFFMIFSSYAYAAKAKTPEDVLTEIVAGAEIKRTETEIKRQNGAAMGTVDRISLPSGSTYIKNNKLYIKNDENENSYQIKVSFINSDGKKQTVNGKIEFDGGNMYFKTNNILPSDSKTNYTFELIDKNGKAVVEKSKIKLNIVTEEEKTADGTSVLGAVGDAILQDYRRLGRLVVETICRLITPVGDAFLDMISAAIGEIATIDGAVYNRINKVDIDFFSIENEKYYNEDGTIKDGVSIPLKNQMKDVVNTMYGMFRGLAIMVLLVMLVYIGIKIMLTSTAERKASYKSLFMAWVMGVTMLMFFPYVMKYTIQLNSALCAWIGGGSIDSTSGANSEPYSMKDKKPVYGTDDFIDQILREDENISENAMMYVRYYGANFYNLPLLIVYLIMIGQLIAILVMYYKRVFMIAFLISIFPLVAMIYPLNKIGDVKMNPFGTWFKEFAVNVFVQAFHAATFKVIVNLGISSWQDNGNWLFMIMCILFLFEGEKIIRAIFNAKSSMNTIGDMAMAGAMAMNIMKKAGKLIPDLSKSKDDSDKDTEMDAMKKAKSDRVMATSTPTPGAESNLAEGRRASGRDTPRGSSSSRSDSTRHSGEATAEKSFSGTPIDIDGTGEESAGVELGRQVKEDTSTPFSTAESHIQETKKNRKFGDVGSKVAKFGGSAFSAASQVTGATMGMTYGLAQSDNQAAISGLAAGASTGKKVGDFGRGLVESAVDKYADVQAAKVVADEYMTGEHDEEIGAADNLLDREKAQKLRELHARLATRAAGFGSKEGAQLKFIKERLEIEEKTK